MGEQLEHLVHIVAKLALGNGPGLLVMPLEGCDLGPYNWSLPAAIIIHAPVINARQKICKVHSLAFSPGLTC